MALERVRTSFLEVAGQVQEAIPDPVKVQFNQGPAGIQYVSFGVGVGIVSVNMLQLYHIFDLVSTPAEYVLHGYQLLGGICVVLLELDTKWIDSPVVAAYREVVSNQANFLTHLLGRGLFYMFQGSVAVVQPDLLENLMGWLITCVGILYILFHKLLPQEKTEDEHSTLNRYMRCESGQSSIDGGAFHGQSGLGSMGTGAIGGGNNRQPLLQNPL